jgi:hypothetical protein
MSRYVAADECQEQAKVNDKLRFGWFSLHMSLEDYNWAVGFSNEKNDMVYVPGGAKLMGSNKVEYELVLQPIAPSFGIPNFQASLVGTEERFGLEAKVSVPLDYAMMLRFDDKAEAHRKSVFTVKSLPLPRLQAEPAKPTGLRKYLSRVI